jgi:HEAT repeat protein
MNEDKRAMIHSRHLSKKRFLPSPIFLRASRQVTVILSALALTAPQLALASSAFPPLDISSYAPFNTRCTQGEIEHIVAQLNNPARADFVFRALTACGAEAVPTLVELLGARSPEISDKAIDALIDIGPEAEAALPDLVRMLREGQENLPLRLPHAIAIIGGAETVPVLIQALNHPNVSIRQRAAWALGDLGPAAQAAVPALREALQNPETRRDAARGLGDIGEGSAAAVPDLIALLADDRADDAAVNALGQIGRAAVPALIRAVESPNAAIRKGAVDALRRMRSDAAPAVEVLIVALEDEDLRFNAVDALGEIGPAAEAAIPAIVPLLGNTDVDYVAVDALVNIGERAVPATIGALESPDANTRSNAIQVLRQIGPGAAAAVPVLTELLNDHTELSPGLSGDVATIRIQAIQALGAIGPQARAAIPDLIVLFHDSNELVRLTAALALAGIGKDAVPALTAALHQSESRIQVLAAIALGEIGPDAQPAAPALIQLVESSPSDTPVWEPSPIDFPIFERPQPILPHLPPQFELDPDKHHPRLMPPQPPLRLKDDPLKNDPPNDKPPDEQPEFRIPPIFERPHPEMSPRPLDWPSITPVIPPIIINPDPRPTSNVQTSAALALGKIGVPVERAIPYLIPLLRSENAGFQAEAAAALGNMGATAQAAVPDVVTVMGRGGLTSFVPVLRARQRATDALISIGAPAVPDLVEALHSDNVVAHSRAAYALSQIGEPAIPALIRTLADGDRHVRRRTAFALGKIGSEAVPPLLESVRSPNLDVRKAAAAALGMAESSRQLILPTLESIVSDTDADLDLRRIAASALQQLGGDASAFFETSDFRSPETAACPPIDMYDYEFDVLTGNCLMTYEEGGYLAGIGDILRPLCRFLGC